MSNYQLLFFVNLLFSIFFTEQQLFAQDTLKLSRQACEARFLNENLLLIAERFNIESAQARILQAKLWPNPVLTVDQVNFWARENQLFDPEGLPPMIGNWGQNRELGIQVEQLILTAGKRKKLVNLEETGVLMAEQTFALLLHALKSELRTALIELSYSQKNAALFSEEIRVLDLMLKAYEQQIKQGNIGQSEFIRLKALRLQLFKELHQISKERLANELKIKGLLNIDAQYNLLITDESSALPNLTNLQLDALITEATAFRADMQLAQLEQSYFDRLIAYEKAMRKPDLNLIGSYDRGGNFMLNFIGFGIGLELPFFNRNQGNIRQASIGKSQAEVLLNYKGQQIAQAITLAYQKVKMAEELVKEISNEYTENITLLLESYRKNFTQRNISILEYLDFLEAYLTNMQIFIEAQKDLAIAIENLQFEIGKDL